MYPQNLQRFISRGRGTTECWIISHSKFFFIHSLFNFFYSTHETFIEFLAYARQAEAARSRRGHLPDRQNTYSNIKKTWCVVFGAFEVI
jgi:hypothetical protein